MSETRTRHQTPVDPGLEDSGKQNEADPLQESLDELASMADSLVDGLVMDEEEPVFEADPHLKQEPSKHEPGPQGWTVTTEPAEETAHEAATEAAAEETASAVETQESDSAHEAHEGTSEPPTGDEKSESASSGLSLGDLSEQKPKPDEQSQQARRAALRETLDALNHLIDDKPPAVPKEIQVEGDRGEDISACLDVVMAAPEKTDETESALEAHGGATEAHEDGAAETEVAESPGKNAPPVAPPDPTEETGVETAVAMGTDVEATAGVDEASVDAGAPVETHEDADARVETPEDADTEVEVPLDTVAEVTTSATAVAEPAIETVSATHTERPQRSKLLWWMMAVVVIVAALAASYWVLNVRSTSTPTTTPTSAEVPVPDPPVVYTQRPQIRTQPKPTQAAPIPAEPVAKPVARPARRPPAQEAASTPPPAIAAAATPSEPTAAPVEQPPVRETVSAPPLEVTVAPAEVAAPPVEAVAEPAPATPSATEAAPAVALAPDTPTQVETAAPQTGPTETMQGDAPAPTPAMLTSRGKTTETGSGQPQAAGLVDLSVAEIVAPIEPQNAEVMAAQAPASRPRSITVEPVVDDPPIVEAAPAGTPPVLIDRVEPVFDRRSLRRGETQNVVLSVLVNERGRVVRVVVDESVDGSDSEFAAINAVLRWTYEPALEDGEPVRSWTTESFEFSRPK